jgi:hypothetical protein
MARENKRQQKRHKRKRKVNKLFLSAAAFISAAALVVFCIDYVYYKTDYFDISSIKTKGNSVYDDNYIVMFQHKNGNKGVMFNDVVSRKGGRKIEVFSEQLHLTWNGTPDSLYDYDIEKKEDRQILTYENVEHQELYNIKL